MSSGQIFFWFLAAAADAAHVLRPAAARVTEIPGPEISCSHACSVLPARTSQSMPMPARTALLASLTCLLSPLSRVPLRYNYLVDNKSTIPRYHSE